MKISAKKVCACLLLTCGVSVSLLRADNLLNAIDNVDVYQAKRLLSNEQFTNNTREYKKRVLDAAYESAKLAKKATQRLIPHNYDLVRMGVGGGLGYAAVLLAKLGMREHGDLAVLSLGVAGVTGLIGLNQMYKGLTHYSARKRLAQAREIEALVSSQQIVQE